MKIKVTYTKFNVKVPRQVVKVYRVSPIGMPEGIPDDTFTQKGGILVGTAPGQFTELPPGINGYVLMYDNAQATGLRSASIIGLANAPRVTAIASSGAPTPNADDTDLFIITSLAGGATFGAPTGTPLQGQKLIVRILDNGVSRALAWNAVYRAVGQTLPTATTANKTLYLGFIYNATASKWDLVAKSLE